jgi:hypothetical protein
VASRIDLIAILGVACVLGGCATVTQSPTQPLQVLVLDAQDRPVRGMACHATNGISEADFTTPVTEISIHRTAADLEIECHHDAQIAKGSVSPRRDGLEQALIPFGSLAVALDHVTGKMYTYPTMIRMRLGKHLRFEHSDEARATKEVATIGDTLVADINASRTPRVPLPEPVVSEIGDTRAATASAESKAAAARAARAVAKLASAKQAAEVAAVKQAAKDLTSRIGSGASNAATLDGNGGSATATSRVEPVVAHQPSSQVSR